MFDFEYHNIIDYWAKEFRLYMSMDERNELIEIYEQALVRYNTDLDFDDLCKSICIRKYLLTKYGKLGYGVWGRLFSKSSMN
jgi:hypothetical protein